MTKPLIEQVAEAERVHRTREPALTVIGQASIPMPHQKIRERRMSREANADMVEGFRDGYDLTAPEPSANRSASYRHGFMCGRIDRRRVAWSGTADELRKMAGEAMEEDGRQQTPGA